MARVTAPQLLSALVLATLLAGCASNVLSPGGSGVPVVSAAPDAGDRIHQQAHDALERWAAAVRANGGASITFVGEMTSQIGSWEANNGDNKVALEAGAISTTTSLPDDRPDRRQGQVGGRQDRRRRGPLGPQGPRCPHRVGDGRLRWLRSPSGDRGENLATALAETSTGPAEVCRSGSIAQGETPSGSPGSGRSAA